MFFALVPVALLGLAGGLYYLPPKFIIQPDTSHASPAESGVADANIVTVPTDDGEKLVAWYADPKDARRPIILYFHGQSGALAHRNEQFNRLIEHGYGLLAIAYRGFNESTGSPSEEGLKYDADGAYAEALRRGFAPSRIVLMGESLGTGVATFLASRREVAAVVLDSPYDNIPAVIDTNFHVPAIVSELVLRDKFHSDAVIDKVKAPVFMSVGKTDGAIPPQHGLRLYNLAHDPKQLIESDCGHITFKEDKTALAKAMAWIDATLAPKP
jgi:fermentation-respiration switch protein FrsA (DUF1100 family)